MALALPRRGLPWHGSPPLQQTPSPSPSPPPEQPTVTFSDRYNAEDADVTYQSSDNVRFRIHSIYLKTHTAGLAPPSGLSLEEVAYLPERSAILETLFDFIYPIEKLSLAPSLKGEFLFELAEVAEKYVVYPVMSACVVAMRDTLPLHALDILAHALKHNYQSLANEAAPHLIDLPGSRVISVIPVEFHITWLSYQEKWAALQRQILSTELEEFDCRKDVIEKLAANLSALRDLNATFGAPEPFASLATLLGGPRTWRGRLEMQVARIGTLLSNHGCQLPNDAEDEGDEPGESLFHEDLVTLITLDGVVYRASRKVLVSCAPGFAKILSDPSIEQVQLEEMSDVIADVLAFLRPRRTPNIGSFYFDAANNIAYAAEKYKVYHCMYLCNIFMEKNLQTSLYREDVFIYAAKFGYNRLLDKGAPLLVGTPLRQLLDGLPPSAGVAWAKYYELWNSICQDAVKTTLEKYSARYPVKCEQCRRLGTKFFDTTFSPVIKGLMVGPGALKNIDGLFPNTHGSAFLPTPCQCPELQPDYDAVKELIVSRIASLPLFSELIQV